jgi:hypothetical protein
MRPENRFLTMLFSFIQILFFGTCGLILAGLLNWFAFSQLHLISYATFDTIAGYLMFAGAFVFLLPVIIPMSIVVGKVCGFLANNHDFSAKTPLEEIQENDWSNICETRIY